MKLLHCAEHCIQAVKIDCDWPDAERQDMVLASHKKASQRSPSRDIKWKVNRKFGLAESMVAIHAPRMTSHIDPGTNGCNCRIAEYILCDEPSCNTLGGITTS
eukprot:7287287-Karenia_brevis.AAC.1